MSRRSRLHYHLATIGYWASRMQARSPRPEGLPGDSLSFGAAVRYELPSHTTSRQNRHPDLSRRDDSCNCFSLMVTSDRSHKGLSPSITAPCPAHHHAFAALDGALLTMTAAAACSLQKQSVDHLIVAAVLELGVLVCFGIRLLVPCPWHPSF